MSLSLNVKFQDDFKIIEMEGRILSEADLDPAHQLLDENKTWKLVFDLSKLQHTNSSGIAFLVKSMTRARIHGGEVIIMHVGDGIKKLFEITKMHEVFPIVESLNEAKSIFKS
jgi:anti-sigma B factor antagonist/stage II sporulation protein AA (anti-sigma F factor antagonist)